jgi:hypothetical protein
MLFIKKIAVSHDSHTKPLNLLWEQNAEICGVNIGGPYTECPRSHSRIWGGYVFLTITHVNEQFAETKLVNFHVCSFRDTTDNWL